MGDHVHGGVKTNDGIAHHLARAMPGDLAAAIHVDDWRAVVGALVPLGALTSGIRRRVLQKQDRVGRCASRHLGMNLALHLPCGEVVHRVGSKSDTLNLHGCKPTRPTLWITLTRSMVGTACCADGPRP